MKTMVCSAYTGTITRTARGTAALGCVLLLSGCQRAPAYSILGSFFPVWLFCALLGVLISFLLHLVLLRLEWNEQLSPPLLVYPSIAILLALGIWLVCFS
ncbi:YtcA family lipoprotein [Acidipila sp. EB88]|uniref:YtcA family lipoprotein n=1 Tax=Acidipila sp. EB88 TaxID=2305226 RepID=UPI000F5E4C86|nr:YtcA family lipoprotein [Acidipila sp. EB88]RRA47315.1 hypothetical protein D1Y84_02395 [Acidipila sp. EB88]